MLFLALAADCRNQVSKTRRFAQKSPKGFGDPNAVWSSPKKAPPDSESGESPSDGESGAIEKSTRADKLAKDRSAGTSTALTASKLTELRDKTLALRQKREAEIDEYETAKALIAKYGPQVGVMPAKVATRAAKRGMVIGGSFYATMLLVFAAGIVLYRTQEIVIPPTLMGFITGILVVLAILGGSYGLMSASWDEDREGSLLGASEFSKNMNIMGDSFRRALLQGDYEKAIEQRMERRKLLEAKEERKKGLLKD